MAVFLLKTKYGSSYVPPGLRRHLHGRPVPLDRSPTGSSELAGENITGGCGGTNYCPQNPNTRGQMAVFIVKTFGLQ